MRNFLFLLQYVVLFRMVNGKNLLLDYCTLVRILSHPVTLLMRSKETPESMIIVPDLNLTMMAESDDSRIKMPELDSTEIADLNESKMMVPELDVPMIAEPDDSRIKTPELDFAEIADLLNKSTMKVPGELDGVHGEF